METVLKAGIALFENLDSPISRLASAALREGRHHDLVELTVDASAYTRDMLPQFRDDYLATEYFSKYPGLQLGVDAEQAAYDSFWAAEAKNKATNERLRLTDSREFLSWAPVFVLAQRKISQLIGDRLEPKRLFGMCKWGPGSTFSLQGEDARLDAKLLEKQLSVTPRALRYLRSLMSVDLGWLRSRGYDVDGPCTPLDGFQLVRGNRAFTVPKNAKTERFCAAEPTGNCYLQLGVGQTLRRALKQVAINLDDQSTNQRLAEVAFDRGLATIDLRNASNSITTALVWLLMPFEWACVLDDLRSPSIRVKGEDGNPLWHETEMFSTMGNGFTFELETLLFYTLTGALMEYKQVTGSLSVYGDDIICPADVVPDLIRLFDFVGFEVNTKKSHWLSTDPFRESCGKHYLYGQDVTPIYQKEICDRDDGTYRAHNRLLYHAVDRGHILDSFHAVGDRRFLQALRILRKGAKLSYEECRIPLCLHASERSLDGGWVVPGIHTEWDTLHGSRWRNYIKAKALVRVPFNVEADEAAVYAYSLQILHRSGALQGLWRLDLDGASAAKSSAPWKGKLAIRGREKLAVKRRYFSHWGEIAWA